MGRAHACRTTLTGMLWIVQSCSLGPTLAPPAACADHRRPPAALAHLCRFRVNMGNVHFEQGKYPSAIKMYRMALDALPPSAAYQRARLMTNIGLAFVQLGQYADAASTFESALDMAPDHQVSGVDSSWCFGMKPHALWAGWCCGMQTHA